MNLKYYLRGLGLGIVFTAIIMGIASGSKKAQLSDEDIIIKAKNLGMIEEAELSASVQEAKDKLEQEIRAELEARITAEMEQTKKEQEAVDVPEPVPEPVVFKVRKGETPYSISERLEESGLVGAAADFDKYLVDNGYDRKIVASEYTIPLDADMDTIARIITGHKVSE